MFIRARDNLQAEITDLLNLLTLLFKRAANFTIDDINPGMTVVQYVTTNPTCPAGFFQLAEQEHPDTNIYVMSDNDFNAVTALFPAVLQSDIGGKLLQIKQLGESVGLDRAQAVVDLDTTFNDHHKQEVYIPDELFQLFQQIAEVCGLDNAYESANTIEDLGVKGSNTNKRKI